VVAEKTILSQRHSSGKLIVQQGPQAGNIFFLKGALTILGREPGVDIALNDPECSRQHIRITSLPGSYMIEDLGSTNGSLLNGEPLSKPQLLNSGDTISLGKTILIFESKELNLSSSSPDPVIQPALESVEPAHVYEKILKEQGIIPSRYVLSNAIETAQNLGHENLGFLSEKHGFMPSRPPLLKLPPSHQAWDEIVKNLPELYRTLKLRGTLERMPILSADADTLPDEYLLRASMIISILGHAYFRIQPDSPSQMPDSIMQPWRKITQRLGRPGPVLSYIDLIIYNWKLVNPAVEDPITVENMLLMVPTVDNIVERIFYLGQVEILSRHTRYWCGSACSGSSASRGSGCPETRTGDYHRSVASGDLQLASENRSEST